MEGWFLDSRSNGEQLIDDLEQFLTIYKERRFKISAEEAYSSSPKPFLRSYHIFLRCEVRSSKQGLNPRNTKFFLRKWTNPVSFRKKLAAKLHSRLFLNSQSPSQLDEKYLENLRRPQKEICTKFQPYICMGSVHTTHLERIEQHLP